MRFTKNQRIFLMVVTYLAGLAMLPAVLGYPVWWVDGLFLADVLLLIIMWTQWEDLV